MHRPSLEPTHKSTTKERMKGSFDSQLSSPIENTWNINLANASKQHQVDIPFAKEPL